MKVARVSPMASDARLLMDELSNTLTEITGDGGRASFDPQDFTSPRAVFAVASDGTGNLLGCGGFRPLDKCIAEIKRMYARAGTRDVGRTILRYLETEALALGYEELWLETRLVNTRAIAFYERNGYRRRENYGKYEGNPQAVCFEKSLLNEPAPGKETPRVERDEI